MQAEELDKLLLLLGTLYPNAYGEKAKNERYAVKLVLEGYSYNTAKEAVLEFARTKSKFVPTAPELAQLCAQREVPVVEDECPAETVGDDYWRGLYMECLNLGIELDGRFAWLKKKMEEIGC